MDMTEKDIERFWSKVDKTGECWEWTASTHLGYGAFKLNGSRRTAHRIAWYLANGPIPPKLHVCHTCDNRKCVNAEHMFLGTIEENMMDAQRKGRLVGHNPLSIKAKEAL